MENSSLCSCGASQVIFPVSLLFGEARTGREEVVWEHFQSISFQGQGDFTWKDLEDSKLNYCWGWTSTQNIKNSARLAFKGCKKIEVCISSGGSMIAFNEHRELNFSGSNKKQMNYTILVCNVVCNINKGAQIQFCGTVAHTVMQ